MSHDTLLVSFVSQSEYYETKYKMKLLCDQNKNKKFKFLHPIFRLRSVMGLICLQSSWLVIIIFP